MAKSHVYLLCSDDPLLKKERSEQIIALARKELPQAEFMLFSESDFKNPSDPDLNALENELVDPGLFGGDRIIRIYLRALNMLACRVMLLIARRMRDGIFVIIDLPRVNSSYARLPPAPYKEPSGRMGVNGMSNLAVSAIKGIGGSLEILYPPEGEQLTRWIQSRSSAYGMRCSLECAQMISSMGEGNLISIDQSLRVISMTLKGGDLTPQIIDKSMSSDSRFTGFEFSEAVLSGNYSRALNVLYSLANSGGSLIDTLGFLCSRLDSALSAVATVRQSNVAAMSFRDRSIFFMKLGVKTPGLQDAVLRAATTMPAKLYDFLTSKLASASSELCLFDTQGARRDLEDLCVAVGNFDVMELKRL